MHLDHNGAVAYSVTTRAAAKSSKMSVAVLPVPQRITSGLPAPSLSKRCCMNEVSLCLPGRAHKASHPPRLDVRHVRAPVCKGWPARCSPAIAWYLQCFEACLPAVLAHLPAHSVQGARSPNAHSSDTSNIWPPRPLPDPPLFPSPASIIVEPLDSLLLVVELRAIPL